jgi:hypothetical protein
MHTDNYEFLAEFGQALGILEQKKSVESHNGGDLLSNLLSVSKNNPKPIVEEPSKPKKKEEDVEHSHEYFKKALKPIRASV